MDVHCLLPPSSLPLLPIQYIAPTLPPIFQDGTVASTTAGCAFGGLTCYGYTSGYKSCQGTYGVTTQTSASDCANVCCNDASCYNIQYNNVTQSCGLIYTFSNYGVGTVGDQIYDCYGSSTAGLPAGTC